MSLEYDVFICHATEDKEQVAEPVAERLREKGVRVWYDKFSIKLGDSLGQKIDEGLRNTRFGLVIFSKAFFAKAKNWPRYELDGLLTKEMNGHKVILPVWHNITKAEMEAYSPSLAGKLAAHSRDLDSVIAQVLDVLNETPASPGSNTFRTPTVNPTESAWLKNQLAMADADPMKPAGFFQMMATLSIVPPKTQLELKQAAQAAAIHNYGWPIGVCLTRNDLAPKPIKDGIAVQIDSNHYQRWALSTNGDFFVRESFVVEDDRDNHRNRSIYWNIRAIRLTECFLYIHRLATIFNAPPNTVAKFEFKHSGISSRILLQSGNEFWPDLDLDIDQPAFENEIEYSVDCTIKDIPGNIIGLVKQVCEPLYAMFNFTTISAASLESVIGKYARECGVDVPPTQPGSFVHRSA